MASNGKADAGATLPPIKMLLRSKEGLRMMQLSQAEGGEKAGLPSLAPASALGEYMQGDVTEFSPDGALVAIVTNASKTLRVVEVETGKELWSAPGRPVQALAFSPQATYLLTWERLAKDGAANGGGDAAAAGNGDAPAVKGNLLVWRVADGELLAGFTQKVFRKPDWPTLQWTKDESLAFKSTSTEVQVFNGQDVGSGAVAKHPMAGLGSIRLAPTAAPPYRLACFFPESKGKPASVRVVQYPQMGVPLAAKSFYKAQEAHLRWSPNGQAVLIHTHTDVDTSGVSYYGSTGLYLLHADGSCEVTVPLPKEGPISDAQWAPAAPSQFVVLAGRMPAAATLYNMKAEPVFEFGQAHRNTVSFSPHGRFLVLAGFGNLAGEMDFWDRNKQKLLGRNASHCAVGYGWSPCGRYFMTATLAPRMNVDNGVKLFKYNGAGPVYHLKCEDGPSLFDAQFRPATLGVFPDRPATPPRKGEEAASAAAVPPPTVAAKPRAVYRPPGSTGALAAMLRAEREAVAGPQKVTKGSSSAASYGQPYIPGLAAPAEESKSAARNKAKKEKKKAAAAAKAEAEAAEAEAARAAEAAKAAEAAQAPIDPAKKKKALEKKLKQIDELRKRAAGGEVLNADQKDKLAAEKEIRQQLAALGL